MSRFWTYFHDRLAWPQLFQPGPLSAIVKGLALYMDDVREDIIWLRRQCVVDTAEDDMLERYGASRGILRTRFDTDASYRLRVSHAYAWHKLGGTVSGLRRILGENGYPDAIIRNARQCDGSRWAQFDVLLPLPPVGFDDDDNARLRWLIVEYKPARSMPQLVTDTSIPCPLRHGLAVVCATRSEIKPWEPTGEAPDCTLRHGLATVGRTLAEYAASTPETTAPGLGARTALAVAGRTVAAMQ